MRSMIETHTRVIDRNSESKFEHADCQYKKCNSGYTYDIFNTGQYYGNFENGTLKTILERFHIWEKVTRGSHKNSPISLRPYFSYGNNHYMSEVLERSFFCYISLFRSIEGNPKSILKWQRIRAVETMNIDTVVGCGMRNAELWSRTFAQGVVSLMWMWLLFRDV